MIAIEAGRAAFVSRLDELFTRAGVGYVVLHSPDDSARRDSDIDVAVASEDVTLVDVLLRSGELGRVVQRIDHGIPWCRYYVVATGDPSRPYRQIDIAADPWGLSPLGRSIPLALASANGDGNRPRPAEQAILLLAKRAHKGLRGADDSDALVESYRRNPIEVERLVSQEFGQAGERAAAALREGAITDAELEALRRSMTLRRLRPPLPAYWLGFAAWRLATRLMRPTGLSVVIAGPDGVGKSSLTARLPYACAGIFWRSSRLHLKPGLLPPAGRLLGRQPTDITDPHGRSASSSSLSAVRILYLWIDCLLGWMPEVAIPRRRSGLVLIERGWRDLEVDPRRYRLQLPGAFVRVLGRLVPRADLVLVLAAGGQTVTSRKTELSASEVDRQVERWRSLATADPSRHVEIDASLSEADVLGLAVRAIENRLATRQRPLRGLQFALSVLGGLRHGGRRHSLVSVRREPRWILPGGIGEPGPLGTRLYRPFRLRQAAGALALECVHRAGTPALLGGVPIGTEQGLAAELAGRLGVRHVELGALATGDSTRGQRAVLAVRSGGRTICFAKVALESGPSLIHENDVLQALARADLEVLVPPRVIDCFAWQGSVILLLEPLPTTLLSDRRLGHVEVSALAELKRIAESLAPALEGSGGTPIHGDFAPWNSTHVAGGRLAVWDWEETRLGSPLEDVFHWRIQRHLRGGDETLEEIVADAEGPGPETLAAARRLGVDPASAPLVLRSYFEHALGTPPRNGFPGVARVRAEGLARLTGVES